MLISATIRSSGQRNDLTVATQDNQKSISIPAKPDGTGSSVNGGELLFLALATCFCNDIYREATRRNIIIEAVEVTVRGEFGKEGEPGSNITYTAKVESGSSPKEISDLIAYTDKVAEIHNTLRQGVPVTLRD